MGRRHFSQKGIGQPGGFCISEAEADLSELVWSHGRGVRPPGWAMFTPYTSPRADRGMAVAIAPLRLVTLMSILVPIGASRKNAANAC
jgi:hypothetical protein